MNLRLKKLTIENFRGISNAEVTFGEFNFLVGDNGTGKTTLLAAIARLMPALRQEDRIFLDADFSFNSLNNAESIKLIYDVAIIPDDDSSNNLTIELIGERQNTGISRSHLNDQQSAKTIINFSNKESAEKLLIPLTDKGILKQRVTRNGWGGGRSQYCFKVKDDKGMRPHMKGKIQETLMAYVPDLLSCWEELS